MKRSSAIAKGLRAPPVGEFCRHASACLKISLKASHQPVQKGSCKCGRMYRSNTLQVCMSGQLILLIPHCPKGITDPHLLAISLAPVHWGQAEVLRRQVEDVEAALRAGRAWVVGMVRCCSKQRRHLRGCRLCALWAALHGQELSALGICHYALTDLLSKLHHQHSLCAPWAALSSPEVLLHS